MHRTIPLPDIRVAGYKSQFWGPDMALIRGFDCLKN